MTEVGPFEIPPNFKVKDNFMNTSSVHLDGRYYCSMCEKKSNGYVDMAVPEGCLVVSSCDIEIKD